MNNNKALVTVGYVLLGLVVGYLLWGRTINSDMHKMPNGEMMHNMHDMDMQSMMDGMMQNLDGKMGAEFDQAFLAEMIVHHQGAVVMAEAVLKQSTNPELIKLANDIITAQNGEIKMMQDWQKVWPQK